MVGWINKLSEWTSGAKSRSMEYYSAIKKEQVSCNHIDESQMHCAKGHIPDSED